MMLRAAAVAVAGLAIAAAGHPVAERAVVVTVLAESGSPLRDLAAADFVVKEKGKKLSVLEAKLSTDPLSVALVIDAAQPAPGIQPPTSELRAGLANFVRIVRGANADARVALWQVGNAPIPLVEFNSKQEDLDSAIARFFFNKDAAAVVLEGLEAAGRQLAGAPGSRRAIVVVEFGSPEATGMGAGQKTADSVANSGATLWAVSIRGTSSANSNREDLLDNLTKASGGKRYSTLAASGLEPRLRGIAASLVSQYQVTFERAGDDQPKALSFETTKGARVLATPFYR